VPLLSVEDVRLVYANLDIQLQSARLAALKGDAANYQVSLDGAGQLLSVYFDAQQKPVQAVIETLNEIKSLELAPRLPDISKSLKMIRSLRSADNSSLATPELK
jgi:uroporphyrin-3 C-methyltransferase